MTFVSKKAPAPSLHLLEHPESDTEYRHFQVALEGDQSAPARQALPFDQAATAFSPINAWWLAEAALLAYWNNPIAADRFQTDAGLSSVPFDEDGTQGYVASDGQFAIVAFRGTQPNERADVWTDAQFVPKAWEGGGQVHEGFIQGLNAVWTDVAAKVTQTGATSVWFTGHSLGAALAVLAADRFGSAAGVYTVGSPRVGDPEFVQKFNGRHRNRSFRYVNHHDVVTHVPPSAIGFGHVDEERHFDEDGILQGTAVSGRGVLDLAPSMLSEVSALVSGASLLPRALVDHTPRRYATYTWNALVASLAAQR